MRLWMDGLNLWFKGISVNMSQMGAAIRTEYWSFFQVDDETIVTCFLPPAFTGQNGSIALRGDGTIRRIDPVNECVAVEFLKSFRQFERCDD